MRLLSILTFIISCLSLMACQLAPTPIEDNSVATTLPTETVILETVSATSEGTFGPSPTIRPSLTSTPSPLPAKAETPTTFIPPTPPLLPPSDTPTPSTRVSATLTASTPLTTSVPLSTTAILTPTLTPLPTASAILTSSGHITVGLLGKLDSFNPLIDLGLTLADLSPLLYHPLLKRDPISALTYSNIVTLSAISDDGLTLTYTMNVDTLSPNDIQSSLETAIWPALTDIRDISPVGQNQVRLRLTQANCALIDALSDFPILTQDAVTAKQPTATGPFQIESWDEEAGILILIANPTAPSPPRLEKITVRLFENEELALQALSAGALDILPLRHKPNQVPADYQLIDYPSPLMTFVSFNNNNGRGVNKQVTSLGDGAVRRALRLAVDRERVLELAFDGDGDLASGILLPSHWAAESTLSPPRYDPVLAGTLLDEAGFIDTNGDGWRDIPSTGETWYLPIRVNEENRWEQNVAFVVAEAYRHVGVQAKAEPIPLFILLDDLLTADYNVAVYSLPIPAVLDHRKRWHSGQIGAELGLNLATYVNAQVDSWLAEANGVSNCDLERRAALYQKIQSQLNQDHAVDFLVNPTYFIIAHPEVMGLKPGPFAPFTWNVAEWYLDK